MLKQLIEEEIHNKKNIFNKIQYLYTMDNYVVNDTYKQTLDTLKKDFNCLKSQLNEITLLDINDKLGFDTNGNIFIDKSDSMQCIRRWYFNQNRDLLLQYLPPKLEHLTIFIETLLDHLNNPYNYYVFRIIGLGLMNLVEGIVKGLTHLDTTYVNDIHIHTFLHKYITLLQEKLIQLTHSKGITHVLYTL